MKLTFNLKPTEMFKLMEILQKDVEEASSSIDYYSRCCEEHEGKNDIEWYVSNLKYAQEKLETANALYGAFMDALDHSVTLFDFAKSTEE